MTKAMTKGGVKRTVGLSRGLHRRVWIVAAVVGLAVSAGGAAVASWTASGSGQGNAKSDTLVNATVDLVTFSSSLSPGGPAVDVDVTFTNPNSFPVVIDSLTEGVTTSSSLGCGTAGNPTGVSLDLSAITGTLAPGESTMKASASMDTTSVSSCQGATFSTSLSLAVSR